MTKRTRSKPLDCIVIGAGVAGLACARRLLDAGLSVVVLEGRGRLGGRILTVRDPALDTPIELGAEFIHGAPPAILDRLNSIGLSFYDLTDHHLQRRGRELVPVDVFEKMQDVMKTLDPERKTDRTVDEFLKAQKSLAPEVAKLVRAYVEGFHAADTRLIGERALAVAEAGGDALNGSEAFRVTDGYDRLVASFLHGIEAKDEIIRLNTIVKRIEWRAGHATVERLSSAGFRLPKIAAKTVVVTVPLGVLKAPVQATAAIEFDPIPRGLTAALGGLQMGHALRLNLRFRSRFWEANADGSHRKTPLGYLHAGPDRDFPTWWTMMPLRSPILTAWQGGPRAEHLAKLPETERVQTALSTLAYLLDFDPEFVQQQLETWYFHDWSSDPFSFGAYSYVGVDGDRQARSIAEPFNDTLFFAGEATHTSHERGTVDGAIETGLRAAKQVLKAL